MKTSPYWIPGPWTGQLAVIARPRGGDWLRDEVQAWRAAGINIVVSALQLFEERQLDLVDEETQAIAAGIHFVSFPIEDRCVPGSIQETVEALLPLEKRLAVGHNVAIHCRGGIGRSPLLAACILVMKGMSPKDAFDGVRFARGCAVPDTIEQTQWVNRFATELARRGMKV